MKRITCVGIAVRKWMVLGVASVCPIMSVFGCIFDNGKSGGDVVGTSNINTHIRVNVPDELEPPKEGIIRTLDGTGGCCIWM